MPLFHNHFCSLGQHGKKNLRFHFKILKSFPRPPLLLTIVWFHFCLGSFQHLLQTSFGCKKFASKSKYVKPTLVVQGFLWKQKFLTSMSFTVFDYSKCNTKQLAHWSSRNLSAIFFRNFLKDCSILISLSNYNKTLFLFKLNIFFMLFYTLRKWKIRVTLQMYTHHSGND